MRQYVYVTVTFMFASLVMNLSLLQWSVTTLSRMIANLSQQSHHETERLASEIARIKASTCASGSSAP